ncbi:MAG: hypothetical protein RI903_1023 [Bacteroidota bacterium]
MKIKEAFLVGLLMLAAVVVQAQVRTYEPVYSEGGGYTSGAYTPFWLRANQFGEVPTWESYYPAGMSAKMEYRKGRRADWAMGATARVNLTETRSDFFFQEAYIKGKFGIFELSAGRKKYIQGLTDTTLSSGSYIYSGNALPMPKIEVVVNDYWAPGFLGGIAAFKGNFVHGWFDKDRSNVTQVYLHQKSFYGRLGKPSWPVKFYGGFNHQVQWGGTNRYLPASITNASGSKTSLLSDYLYVITGKSLAGAGGDTATYGVNEGFNRLGNHLGTIDLGMEIELKAGKLFFYRQSIYEDGSLYYGNNITDGLHGISFTRNAKKGLLKIVAEYFNTTSQGGAEFDVRINIRGFDNYFNNGIYPEGWSYMGKGLGSPLMTLDSETGLNPTFNTYFDNNRVEAFYLGAEALLGENHLTFRGSMSNAIGWFGAEYIPVKRQISAGLQWQRPMPWISEGAQLKANIGFDTGDWKKDVFGGNLSLSIPLL